MKAIVKWMDQHLYPAYANNWDDALLRESILTQLHPSHTVLDVGAGAGIVEQTRLRGLADKVCGVDPDPRVLENPYLDDAHIGIGEKIPYDSETFDVVFCNNVFEHLEQPERVFAEVARVLKPGGCFISKTPNRWHYVPVIASCTPHWFHEAINRRRGRDEDDTFPTYYRANSPRAIRRLANEGGLEVEQIQLFEGRPEYLRLSPLTYAVGWCYERMVNVLPGMSGFRVVMITTLRKHAESSTLSRAA